MNKKSPPLVITESDFTRLSALVANAHDLTRELLEEELHRATVVKSDAAPGDLVTMNSRVRFLDLSTQKESEVELVYPHEADLEQGRISVLAPMGSALIGLRKNQSIEWPLPNGSLRSIRVVSVSQSAGAK